MHLQTILLFVALNEASSYYFYNPTNHDVIIRSSLNNIPSGYKLIPPPKTSRRRARFQRGRTSGYCTDAGFACTSPYDKSLTFQYECDSDNNCPKNYKCCDQKCFVHKICSKAVFTQTGSYNDNNCNGCGNTNNNYQRPGQCERWPYNCPKPYDYSLTSTFKCNSDKQCPKNFKCCQQSCFLHKICSRATSYSNDDVQNWEFTPKLNPTTEAKTETDFDFETEQSTEEVTTEDFESNYDDDSTTDVDTTSTDVDTTTDITTETETESVIDTEEKTEPSSISDLLKPNSSLQTDVTTETDQKQTTTEINIDDDYVYEDEDEDDYDVDDEVENEDEDDGGANSATAEDKEITKINPWDISEFKAFQAKQRKHDLLLTTSKPILGKIKNSHSIRPHDYNEIVPEYAQYYYYYDENNLH